MPSVCVSLALMTFSETGGRGRGRESRLTFGVVPLDVLVESAVHRDGRDRGGLGAAAAAEQDRRRVGVLVRLGLVLVVGQGGRRGRRWAVSRTCFGKNALCNYNVSFLKLHLVTGGLNGFDSQSLLVS